MKTELYDREDLISGLIPELKNIHDYMIATYDPDDIRDEEGNPGIDVRIQLVNGSSEFKFGDSQGDGNHLGSFGTGFVNFEIEEGDEEYYINLAEQMVDDALDLLSQQEDDDEDE